MSLPAATPCGTVWHMPSLPPARVSIYLQSSAASGVFPPSSALFDKIRYRQNHIIPAWYTKHW